MDIYKGNQTLEQLKNYLLLFRCTAYGDMQCSETL